MEAFGGIKRSAELRLHAFCTGNRHSQILNNDMQMHHIRQKSMKYKLNEGDFNFRDVFEELEISL